MSRVRMKTVGEQRAVYAALSQQVAPQTKTVAQKIAAEARARAPKATGAGARSIKARRHWDPKTRTVSYRVGWDRRHFYMLFAEVGTVHQPARPFLRPAADLFGAHPPNAALTGEGITLDE